ncbi:MAG: hypothetical protein K1W12_02675, partial [Turicimonas muris]
MNNFLKDGRECFSIFDICFSMGYSGKTTSDRELPDSATLEYFINAIFNFSKISHSLDFLSREEISLLIKYPFNY